MLKLPQLGATGELQVFQAVEFWARFQNQGRPLDPFISQKLLGPCMQHIRFLALTPSQFSEHVAKSGLLSIEDCLAVLVNLNSPGQMPMPEHLCRENGKRCDSAPDQPPMKRQTSFEGATKPTPKPAAAMAPVSKAEKSFAEEKLMQKEPKKEEEVKRDVKIEGEKQTKPSPAPPSPTKRSLGIFNSNIFFSTFYSVFTFW
jgi:hypothetical protein